jgi:hypothetical protein
MDGLGTSGKEFRGKSVLTQPIAESNLPGYKYNPNINVLSTKHKTPAFSIGNGKAAKSQSCLSKPTSTPANVGPNSYNPVIHTTSLVRSNPKSRFPQAERFQVSDANKCRNETYALYNSVGKQTYSQKRTENIVSVGKGPRAGCAGLLEGKKLVVRLPHAYY